MTQAQPQLVIAAPAITRPQPAATANQVDFSNLTKEQLVEGLMKIVNK